MNTKRLKKVNTTWSNNLSYAIGLITSDGNLSIDGRHISFTTKDLELAENYRHCLNISNKIGVKARAKSKIKKYFVIQFGDKNFYEFLESLGLTKAKSKTLRQLSIPKEFFADFLRGCIDGDGSITASKHPESKISQLKLRLYAYNIDFLQWVHAYIQKMTNIQGGWIYTEKDGSISALTYGKQDTISILRYIYYSPKTSSLLTRKYNVAVPFLAEVAKR